jgi:hypothetical protein
MKFISKYNTWENKKTRKLVAHIMHYTERMIKYKEENPKSSFNDWVKADFGIRLKKEITWDFISDWVLDPLADLFLGYAFKVGQPLDFLKQFIKKEEDV